MQLYTSKIERKVKIVRDSVLPFGRTVEKGCTHYKCRTAHSHIYIHTGEFRNSSNTLGVSGFLLLASQPGLSIQSSGDTTTAMMDSEKDKGRRATAPFIPAKTKRGPAAYNTYIICECVCVCEREEGFIAKPFFLAVFAAFGRNLRAAYCVLFYFLFSRVGSGCARAAALFSLAEGRKRERERAFFSLDGSEMLVCSIHGRAFNLRGINFGLFVIFMRQAFCETC